MDAHMCDMTDKLLLLPPPFHFQVLMLELESNSMPIRQNASRLFR